MRIVHFSDWHGTAYALPPADLYVCTGDMLPDIDAIPPPGAILTAASAADRAREAQERYMLQEGHGYLRRILGNPRAPVVCCRGNHEYADLAPAFAGGPVWEVGMDPARTMAFAAPDGRLFTIGGMRGIMPTGAAWPDEFDTATFGALAARLPMYIDILVTHAPPLGTLDHANGRRYGAPALEAYHASRVKRGSPVKAHLFGHIHSDWGTKTLDGTVYSNAATSSLTIDL